MYVSSPPLSELVLSLLGDRQQALCDADAEAGGKPIPVGERRLALEVDACELDLGLGPPERDTRPLDVRSRRVDGAAAEQGEGDAEPDLSGIVGQAAAFVGGEVSRAVAVPGGEPRSPESGGLLDARLGPLALVEALRPDVARGEQAGVEAAGSRACCAPTHIALLDHRL